MTQTICILQQQKWKKKITSVNLIYNINLYIKHFIVWTAYDEFPLSFNKFNIKQIWSFSLR